MPEISGIAHVELSVRDLEASVGWYCPLFEAHEVFRGTNTFADPAGIVLEMIARTPRPA